jgi:hypothetical protein
MEHTSASQVYCNGHILKVHEVHYWNGTAQHVAHDMITNSAEFMHVVFLRPGHIQCANYCASETAFLMLLSKVKLVAQKDCEVYQLSFHG